MVTKPGTGPFGARDDKSDEDSISLTSTILSEPKDEYPVEAILAEEKFKGITKYLVKWEGYPENRCTWETRSNFQGMCFEGSRLLTYVAVGVARHIIIFPFINYCLVAL